MNLGKKDHYICPFCFTKHNLSEIGFICKNDKANKDGDICVNAKAQRLIPHESEINKITKSIKCDVCGEIVTTKVCPTCRAELPYTIGEYEDLIFAVIGAKEAGKSHYIAVLIDKIMNEIGLAFNCSLQAIDDATIKRYRNDFYYPVFRNNQVIKVTRSAKADDNVSKPLIYTLSFKEDSRISKLLKGNNIKNVVTIAFFDTAGEDLNSEDTMKTVNKYIYNSSGIIFLLDPLQLPIVRESISKDIVLPQQNAEIEDIFSRTANLIRKANGISMNKEIKIPVAVAFSKIDAVEELLGKSCCINYPSKHVEAGEFVLADFEDVNNTMESLVKQWGGVNFTNQLSANFKEYAYFGLTSLGCNPESNKINKLRPHRVEDPFLWLLWKHKLIKVQKRK
ncbi:MAG: hypothetical protein H7Y18_11845 [Clostridiaceae bacterium]|nr:hypothetical protein [Clostridiaceae bacterium]